MDTRNGNIYPDKETAMRFARDFAAPMKVRPTPAQLANIPTYDETGAIGRVGKYDPCPCGSGKQFKWCCFQTTVALRKLLEAKDCAVRAILFKP